MIKRHFSFSCLISLSTLFFFCTLPLAQGALNPLDDFTKEELAKLKNAVVVSKKFTTDVRYTLVSIKEPTKKALTENNVKRALLVGLFEPKLNKLYELDFDPSTLAISNITEITGGLQPPISPEDFERIPKIVKADTRWIDAMKKRGYKDMNDLFVDGWAPGLLSKEESKSGARYMRALTYYRGKNKNAYARPIEGLKVTVDMNQEKVVEFLDQETIPKAQGAQDFDAIPQALQRKGLNPVISTQPQGPSYKITGQQIKWMNWNLRFSLHPMKGVQLYQVGYEDENNPSEKPRKKTRQILHKIGLSEMVVPYGDPGKTWSFRNAFDVGEYGLGKSFHSLKPGVDAPAYAKFVDFVFADEKGNPIVIPKAAAVFERSSGILWKHADTITRDVDTRKGQELVLMFITTIGNYDYGLSYVFQLDGSIELQAQLTGILLAKGTTVTQVPCDNGCIPLVEKNIITPPHQHFFSFRIDFDIDGADTNTPFEVNTKSITDDDLNPDFNAFEKINTPLAKEKEAMRDLNLQSARHWKVANTKVKNALGHPTGYLIMPGENSIPYLGEDSIIRKRAQFINHHVWFTKYKDNEQASAGEYPNQSKGGDGLPQFVSDNETLENTDVVMWYTFGVTHHPRPEEWPIMSVHKTGFKLMPVHFFSRNPSMDLKP